MKREWSQEETDRALGLLERAHGEIALLEVMLGNGPDRPMVKEIASFLTKHGVVGINGEPYY